MAILPASGSSVRMGSVYRAFTNTTPTTGSNISLSSTLGTQIGRTPGQPISFSSAFGGVTTPYDYT